VQNARLVANAEHYYRVMYYGSRASWNLRDLRQPLQTLSLLNGTLRRIVSDPDATDALSQQELAIGAMSRLLNALLDISKLESGAIKPEPTDFTVAELFEELRNDFAAAGAQCQEGRASR
jgi:signal transduction histidine kinase